jgi:hypothetical protein
VANKRNANTWYIDTAHATSADDLAGNNLLVVGIFLTATAANGRVVLADAQGTPVTKLDLRVATSGASQYFDLSSAPVNFPNGISVSTLSNALATAIVKNTGS